MKRVIRRGGQHSPRRGRRFTALCWVGLATIAILVGCGEGDSPSASSIEADLPAKIKVEGKGIFDDVKCLKRSDRTFRCDGTYYASQFALEERIESIVDTTLFTQKDWDILLEQQGKGRSASFDVTVDLDDGSFVYELR